MIEAIGEIVRNAREALRLSVDELAAAARGPAARIAALENGTPGISTSELDRVADQLELDPAALLSGERIPRPRPAVFLRHTGRQDFHAEDHTRLDQALEGGRALRALGALLGAPAPPRFSRGQKKGADAARSGYQKAARARSDGGLGQSNAVGDLRQVAEDRYGVAVSILPLSTPNATAVSVCDADGAAAIVLNARDSQRRSNPLLSRVLLAHELCHVLFDNVRPGQLNVVLDTTDEQVARVARGEQRARAFAAAFLMPERGLEDLLGKPQEESRVGRARDLVSRARTHFRTPWEVAVYHLCNRGYLHRDVQASLLGGGYPQGPGDDTSLPEVGQPSILLVARVREALAQARITEGEAKALLRVHALDALPWAPTP
ncbi:MAG: XRE family transcriptional regulator [Myxococcota bacterium]